MKEFDAKPVYLTPILATLIVSLACTYLIIAFSAEMYTITIFPEGPLGSLGNGIYFVALAAIGALVIYLLLRRKNLRTITALTGFALTAAAFLLSTVYLWPVFSALDASLAPVFVLISGIVLTIAFDYAIFRKKGPSGNVAVLLLGGSLGAFLGMSIQTLSATLILCFLAIYDIFAVYRGPVGKIASKGLERLRGLSLGFKDIQIGLGDLTFYSMLVSMVFVAAGPWYCFFSVLGVLAGSYLAFKMLEKKGIFPGLPFPVALGLLPLLISFLI
jgi:presenilin-like A22 family membrane protease